MLQHPESLPADWPRAVCDGCHERYPVSTGAHAVGRKHVQFFCAGCATSRGLGQKPPTCACCYAVQPAEERATGRSEWRPVFSAEGGIWICPRQECHDWARGRPTN